MIIIIILTAILIILILPFIKEWLRVRSIKSEWEKNDKNKAIQMIIEDIGCAKDRILVYGGTGSIYNEASILSALSSKKIDIEFVLENSKEKLLNTSLFELSKHNSNMHIFSAQGKLFDHHFRVIDYSGVYLEKSHEPESDDRMFKRIPRARFLPGKYSKEFYALRERAIPV